MLQHQNTISTTSHSQESVLNHTLLSNSTKKISKCGSQKMRQKQLKSLSATLTVLQSVTGQHGSTSVKVRQTTLLHKSTMTLNQVKAHHSLASQQKNQDSMRLQQCILVHHTLAQQWVHRSSALSTTALNQHQVSV